jgi:hypothetical protein
MEIGWVFRIKRQKKLKIAIVFGEKVIFGGENTKIIENKACRFT